MTPFGKKDLTLQSDLIALIEDETGGDPMNQKKWVRLSLDRLGELLARRGPAADARASASR